jgi:ferredoxin--NADP+ reductase
MIQYETNAIVTYREDLNDELAVFRVRPLEGTLPAFLSGQYAELAIPEPPGSEVKTQRRSYSIASAPSGSEELEFYIVRVTDGYFTPQLWNLKPNDRIWLGPKVKGKFTLEEMPPGKDLIMVATGTGLAPFLSMIREHRDSPPWRRVVLIHGARFERDLGYRRELEEYAVRLPWFIYIPALTRDLENTAWSGLRGRVQTIFSSGELERRLGEELSREFSHFLLCGNPQMIDDVQALLEARDFHLHKKKNPGNIHVERYW